MDVGKQIEKYRTEAGLSRDALARKVGLSSGQYVYQIERRGAVPSLDVLDRLATALGVAAADLLPGRANHNKHEEKDMSYRDEIEGAIRTEQARKYWCGAVRSVQDSYVDILLADGLEAAIDALEEASKPAAETRDASTVITDEQMGQVSNICRTYRVIGGEAWLFVGRDRRVWIGYGDEPTRFAFVGTIPGGERISKDTACEAANIH